VTVDWRVEGVVGTDLVHQLAGSENLTDGCDQELVVRPQIDKLLASFDIDDAQAPDGTFIERSVHNGLDVRGYAYRVGTILCDRRADI
jgi:hypothetical protein